MFPELIAVKGRLLTRNSISMIVITNASSVRNLFCTKSFRTFLPNLTNHSYTPPMWISAGKLNRLNSFLTQCNCNLVLISPIKTLLYFTVCPNKVCIILRVENSRFTSSRDKPSKTHYKGIVAKEWATSRCTPLDTIQTKRQPHLFSCFLGCFAFRGPKKFPPSFGNGGASCRQSVWRPAIKGSSCFTLRLLQCEHSCRVFLTVVREPRIQYCHINRFRTWTTPSCLVFRDNL